MSRKISAYWTVDEEAASVPFSFMPVDKEEVLSALHRVQQLGGVLALQLDGRVYCFCAEPGEQPSFWIEVRVAGEVALAVVDQSQQLSLAMATLTEGPVAGLKPLTGLWAC